MIYDNERRRKNTDKQLEVVTGTLLGPVRIIIKAEPDYDIKPKGDKNSWYQRIKQYIYNQAHHSKEKTENGGGE